ncbi:hypothetical protein [Actinopolyspora mortivallis]|uniref:hypothetical protein n=1 Tax=Actinopolyspora mortivallis TaxID=33906 RepID=UPI0021594275|nr:hypothetical protein [Actinopolyspora mortivallis]
MSAWIVTTSRREAMKHVSKHSWQIPVDSVQIMDRCTAGELRDDQPNSGDTTRPIGPTRDRILRKIKQYIV